MAEEKRVCMECGKLLKPSQMLKVKRKMYCKECAEEILQERHQSQKSGQEHSGINIVNQQSHNSPEEKVVKKPTLVKNHTTALLFSIFLGWIGVDRFYVGHVGLGILKILLWFTVYGALIWWIIDIILFATKKVSYVKWE